MEILPRFTLEFTSLAINFFILTIVWILYGQLASIFRHFCSSNPVVSSTWADKYIGEPKSTVAAITDAYYRVSCLTFLLRDKEYSCEVAMVSLVPKVELTIFLVLEKVAVIPS